MCGGRQFRLPAPKSHASARQSSQECRQLALEWFRVKRHSDESRNNTMMLRYFKDCWRSAGKKGYTRDA